MSRESNEIGTVSIVVDFFKQCRSCKYNIENNNAKTLVYCVPPKRYKKSRGFAMDKDIEYYRDFYEIIKSKFKSPDDCSCIDYKASEYFFKCKQCNEYLNLRSPFALRPDSNGRYTCVWCGAEADEDAYRKYVNIQHCREEEV